MKDRVSKLTIGIGLLLVLCGAAAGALWLRSSPEKTVKEYLKAAARGDEQRAKALLSTATVRLMAEMESTLAQTMPMAGGMATKMLPMPKGMKVRVGKAQIQGEAATVSIEGQGIRGPGGKAMPAVPWPPVRCVREAGQWRLDFTAQLQMGKQMMALFAQRSPRSGGSRPRPTTAPAAESAPDSSQAASLIAQALTAKRGSRLSEAAKYLRQALALDPDNVEAHWALAWVLADLGKKAAAIAEFEAVVRLSRDASQVAEAQAAIARLR